MTDPGDGQLAVDADPAVDAGYRSERRRFIKAFVDRAGPTHRGERLRLQPLAVAGVIMLTLVAGVAVGAIPHLLKSSGPTSSPGTTGSSLGALAGAASSSPGMTPATNPVSTRPAHPRAHAAAAGSPSPGTPIMPAASPSVPGTPAAPGAPTATTSPAVQDPHASAVTQSPTASSSPAASTVNYQAVTGYGCPQPTDATSDVYGWYTQGTTGFFTVSSGSTTESGCSGAFVAMPMSGSSTTDDTQNLAIWTFRFAKRSEVCRVDVYIPDDTNITHVGGNPSLYTVYDYGVVVGSFYVDQVGQLGSWVTGGSFPISSGVMTLQVHSRGQDWVGSTNTNAHIAVAAARAACQPA